jgi:hypothetical protein
MIFLAPGQTLSKDMGTPFFFVLKQSVCRIHEKQKPNEHV